MSDAAFPNPYNPLAWIKGNPTIGEGTWIGAFCLIDGSGGLTMGKGCNISCGAHLLTHSTVRRCLTGGAWKEIDKARVVVGDHVFVGEHATILMGSVIGDRAVVGAGAVVLEGSVVPECCVVVGNPARIVRRLSPTGLEAGELLDCGCTFDHLTVTECCAEHETTEEEEDERL